MKINQIIRERSQQDDGCPPCPPAAPPAKQRDGAINHPMVNKALTPHWLTNLIPGVNATQTVAKAARDLVNAINDKDPKALAAAVASAPGPLQAAAGTAGQAMGAYDTVKKDGPGFLSKIQSYNPFRSRSGPPAPIEDRIAKPVPAQPYSQRVGEILGDTVGTVTTVPDASGKIKIKTPTGTEIETNKDALLPGAKPGTVQMKPDAAGDALKPGTQVVSAEAMGSEVDPDKLMASMDVAGERKEFDLTPLIIKNNWNGTPKEVIQQAEKWLGDFLRKGGNAYSNLKLTYKNTSMNASQLGDPGQMEDIRRIKELAGTQATPIPGDNLTPVKVPPIPQLPAQDGELGDGRKVTVNADGTRTYGSDTGMFTYNAQGKAIKYQPPSIGGLTQVVDLITGQTSTNFKQGPTTINRTHDATGKSLRTGLNYDLGVANTGIDRDDTSGAASTNIYSRDPDLTKKMAAQGINVPYSVKENTSMRNLLQIVKESDLNQKPASVTKPVTSKPVTTPSSNLTTDEMVAILSGQKTQAQIMADREAKKADPRVKEGVVDGSGNPVSSGSGQPVQTGQPAAVPAPAQPQVDPANYKVPSVDFFKKNYKHPADVIDGAYRSETDPSRIGGWQGGSDFADLMMALSGYYYQARQADPNFKQPAFVKDDWELIQRMLGTPEGKEYAIDQSIGLSNIDDKSPDAEFNRAQHKEFEKQANARFMQQPDGVVTPGWKYDQKLGMTPAQAELQKQKAALVKESADDKLLQQMLSIARLR